jgi:hypothetical protein
MTTLFLRFGRPIAAGLVFLVAAQMSEAAALPLQEQQAQPALTEQETTQQQPATQAPTPAQSTSSETSQAASLPQSPAPAAQQNPDQASPGFASRSQDGQQPQDSQQPVGTAAGPLARPTGVAGSRPAGAAIAPAKQRRVKAIIIRVGLIVGGAAAVGAVVGLSRQSPARPQ